MRLGVGSGCAAPAQSLDIWGEMKLLTLMTGGDPIGLGGAPIGSLPARLRAWDALALATCGGAAVFGLDADVGTLESGKWADLCCVDLGGPATQPLGDPVTQLVLGGGRELVSDVWVAGRHLLSDGEMTRLDWPAAVARAAGWSARFNGMA
jgi:5-methylthioadenosine/S-adenosylhomocysteine deaminase